MHITKFISKGKEGNVYLCYERNNHVKTDKLYSLYLIQGKPKFIQHEDKKLILPGKNEGNIASMSSINYLIDHLKFTISRGFQKTGHQRTSETSTWQKKSHPLICGLKNTVSMVLSYASLFHQSPRRINIVPQAH